MSKASQRRLAEQQKTYAKKFKKLSALEQTIELFFSPQARNTPHHEIWNYLSSKINPDPTHPDRQALIQFLQRIEYDFRPIDQSVQDILREEYEFEPDPTQHVNYFGGRIHVEFADGDLEAFWFDPRETLPDGDKPSDHREHAVKTLKSRWQQFTELGKPPRMMAWAYVTPIGDFPFCYYGLSQSGAQVVAMSSADNMRIMSASVLGDFALSFSTFGFLNKTKPVSSNALSLKSLDKALRQAKPEDFNDPWSAPRQCLAKIIEDQVGEHLSIQLCMADRIRALSNETKFLEYMSDDLLEHEKRQAQTKAEKEKTELKARFDQRLRNLQRAPVGTAPDNTSSQDSVPPAPTRQQAGASVALTLPQRLGHFFGQG